MISAASLFRLRLPVYCKDAVSDLQPRLLAGSFGGKGINDPGGVSSQQARVRRDPQRSHRWSFNGDGWKGFRHRATGIHRRPWKWLRNG